MQYAHSLVDYGLQCTKLVCTYCSPISPPTLTFRRAQVQHRQVGWLTKNRKTGELVREQVPLAKKARMLLLFNPLTEWVDRTHLFRYWLHEKTDHSKGKEEDPRSAQQIKAFVDFYKVDMSQFEPEDISEYKVRGASSRKERELRRAAEFPGLLHSTPVRPSRMRAVGTYEPNPALQQTRRTPHRRAR